MPRIPLADRVTSLEAQVEQLHAAVAVLGAGVTACQDACRCRKKEAASQESPTIGSVGVPITPEMEETVGFSEADDFLFNRGPAILSRLSQGEQQAAIEMTDWLLDENTVKDFFIIWFAANEELRKYILFMVALRNLPISEGRMGLLQGTVGQSPERCAEIIEEVKNALDAIVKQQQAPSPPLIIPGGAAGTTGQRGDEGATGPEGELEANIG